ncbi:MULTISPECIES: EAL domain-containing protein [unclassified Sphingomonas]|uniref:EAL domain-containing protein n=1 Tax=unclassified Sphingomonas TaxID=196159 RepID=UPI001F242AA3|nr:MULTISPECIES: EAL domain-containing protein [unclassified Sphingomonas]
MSATRAAPEPPTGASVAWQRLPTPAGADVVPLSRTGYRFVLLVFIVNFPVVRRRAGLAQGERLMACIADHLERSVADATVAVIGSSTIEITFDVEDFAGGRMLLDHLHQALVHPVSFDGECHIVRTAIGGAGGPKADIADIDLIEAAERALHDARLRGGDRLDDLGDPRFAIDPMDLMRDLPAAIANGEIFLHYQPKLHVRRQCVASAEALVRWRHPTRGLILPGSFIEMAERCLEIAGLTLWTLRQAAVDQRALAAEGHDFPLFVNISGVLLSDEVFVAEACDLIRDSGAQIGIEITETAVIRDPETAIANLKRLATIGVRLAIDDYGAGLSSLSYLKRLPAGELKIDKSFVTELTSSNRDPLIVRSTIDLAHALDMEVTAEGVETPAVMALLSVMGCDMVQGYLISRPIELDALRRFLADRAHIETVASPRLSFRRSEAGWIGR